MKTKKIYEIEEVGKGILEGAYETREKALSIAKHLIHCENGKCKYNLLTSVAIIEVDEDGDEEITGYTYDGYDTERIN